jgi:hypothetical protein
MMVWREDGDMVDLRFLIDDLLMRMDLRGDYTVGKRELTCQGGRDRMHSATGE